jgi:membrane-associated phospholipid phosphatase
MYAHSTRIGSTRWALLALALGFFASAQAPTAAQQVGEGAKVGTWKTWNIASAAEIDVPAPPADTSDQTKAELAELRLLQTLRSPSLNGVVSYWNGVSALQHWTELAFRIPGNGPRVARLSAYVHTAMFDAVVVAYRAKYASNRKSPGQLASDLTPTVSTPGDVPSYPSEHAAIAGAASAVLAFFNPGEAKNYEALAQEEAFSRMIASTNYRSDVEAGLALGRAVAAKAIARAQADGSDAKWTGTVPAGPGYWIGTNPVEPLAGTWKTWILSSGSQIRPGPPPAFDTPEFKAQVTAVKHLTTTMTASERALALYWLNAGPFAPQYDTAYGLMASNNVSLARTARIVGLMGAAAADAVISVWDGKYTYWTIRPTQVDPTIPTLTPVPNYPSFNSGFTAVGSALTEAIGYFFPDEASRMREIAQQMALGRVHEGVHYPIDVETSLTQGRQVVELAIQRDKMNDN